METKSKQLLRSLRGFIPALADSLGSKLDERRRKAEFHAVTARLDLVFAAVVAVVVVFFLFWRELL